MWNWTDNSLNEPSLSCEQTTSEHVTCDWAVVLHQGGSWSCVSMLFKLDAGYETAWLSCGQTECCDVHRNRHNIGWCNAVDAGICTQACVSAFFLFYQWNFHAARLSAVVLFFFKRSTSIVHQREGDPQLSQSPMNRVVTNWFNQPPFAKTLNLISHVLLHCFLINKVLQNNQLKNFFKALHSTLWV